MAKTANSRGKVEREAIKDKGSEEIKGTTEEEAPL